MAVQYAFSQITTTGLKLAVDAADPLSYPGSGTSWTDVTGNGFTGTVSSSISFATTFRGALVSSNSSSAVSFSGSAANFGTDSFTVEMAFSPSVINGRHWLYSKNSGSFPNFGAFVTGSGGSGRITAFFNVSSTISSSATTAIGSIVTGSNYIVDVTYAPLSLFTGIYLNSNLVTTSGANGTGSLTTSASLLLLNNTTSSNSGTIGNLYNFKVYNPFIGSANIRKNYNSMCSRFGLPLALYTPPSPFLLDLYPGAAAAYSLRRLSDFYGGSAIQVRRSSDNAVLDIGFEGDSNLNIGALLAFCGAGDGFVTTWYDQSGNANNASQTTAANQPQIVSSGSVILDLGKPSLQFDGINDCLLSTTPIDPLFITAVNKPNTTNTFKTIFGADTSETQVLGAIYFQYGTPTRSPTFVRATTGEVTPTNFVINSATQVANNTTNLMTGYRSDTFMELFVNNISQGTDTNNQVLKPLGGTNNGRFTLMAGYFSRSIVDHLNGTLSEIIMYTNNQENNINGIHSKINDFYSIY